MIAKWIVVAWLLFTTLATVGSVGKPGGSTTTRTAVLSVVIHGGLMALIVAFWH